MPANTAAPAEQGLPTTLSAIRRPRVFRGRRWLTIPLKWIVGAALTQSLLGAVLVFGWLQRWTQREAVKAWWRQGARNDVSFPAFAGREFFLREHEHAPNWVLAQGFLDRRPGLWGWWRAAFGSIWANLRLGVAGLTNALALTLPGAVLMALGWWGGWQNSFHKGYEQFHVGPAVSVLGLLLFVVAMFYVPLALTRQAVTGHSRAFWQWRTVWTLIRNAWAGCAMLAILYASLNMGAMILKTWPVFIPQAREAQRLKAAAAGELEAMEHGAPLPTASSHGEEFTAVEALNLLNRHYFMAGFYLFGCLLLVRAASGRIYASAVLRAVQSGALGEDQLGEREWRVLHTLGLIGVRPEQPRHLLVRWAAWAATRTGRLVCATTVFLGWFAFIGVVYISEFFNYHPVVGFMNQPLAQLPWFRYIPTHLQSPAGEVGMSVLVLVAVSALAFLSKRGVRSRASIGTRAAKEKG